MREDFEKQCAELTCAIGDAIGPSQAVAVIGAHSLLLHALWNAVNGGYMGESEGVLLVVALDGLRHDVLREAVRTHPLRDSMLDVQVTTPCVLDRLLSQDRAQFAAMIRRCRLLIVWVQPRDLEDNVLTHWTDVYRDMACDAGVLYLGGPWLRRANLEAVHPHLQWLDSGYSATPDAVTVSYWDWDATPIPEDFLRDMRQFHAIVTCPNAALRLRYTEALHRMHIPEGNEKLTQRSSPFQIVTTHALSTFVLPHLIFPHCIAINPEERLFAGIAPTERNGLHLLNTSRFALLHSLAMIVTEAGAPIKPAWPAAVCRLFGSLFRGGVCLDSLDEAARALVEFWSERGIVSVHADRVEPTARAMRTFPGIPSFGALGILHAYRHTTRTETINHEPIGHIDSDFLRRMEYFPLLGKYYQRQLYDQLGNCAVLRMRAPDRGRVWHDAEPVFCSPQTAQAMRRLLADGTVPPCLRLDAAAQAVWERMTAEFADLPASPCIEVSSDAAHWWTFAGAEHNIALGEIITLLAPKLRVSFGNLFLRLTWASECPCDRVMARLGDIAAQIGAFARDGLPDAIRVRLAERHAADHLYGWLFPLLPDDMRRRVFDEDWGVWAKEYRTPDIVPVAQPHVHPHVIDDVPVWNDMPSILPAAMMPKPAPKAAEPPAPPPVVLLQPGTGPMHTHYPWTYVNSDRKLAHAMNVILQQPFIGLDVETTLYDQRLCLIQIGCAHESFLIDPLAVDYSPLAQALSHPDIVKVIHNATFEKTVLGKYGFQILNIVDTMKVSRKVRGKCPEGHSLKAVCKREFGYDMDKTNQTSRWDMRPLTPEQLEYAALDAEIMIHLYRHFFHLDGA